MRIAILHHRFDDRQRRGVAGKAEHIGHVRSDARGGILGQTDERRRPARRELDQIAHRLLPQFRPGERLGNRVDRARREEHLREVRREHDGVVSLVRQRCLDLGGSAAIADARDTLDRDLP